MGEPCRKSKGVRQESEIRKRSHSEDRKVNHFCSIPFKENLYGCAKDLPQFEGSFTSEPQVGRLSVLPRPHMVAQILFGKNPSSFGAWREPKLGRGSL